MYFSKESLYGCNFRLVTKSKLKTETEMALEDGSREVFLFSDMKIKNNYLGKIHKFVNLL